MKSFSLTQAQKSQLHKLAIKGRKLAYSPYSGFKVGASVLFTDGSYSFGGNIENSSYGGTVCAERVAIWSGLMAKSGKKIKAVCVVTDALSPWPPCGLCRQVISEFQSPEALILTANLKKICKTQPFKELFPDQFDSSFLKE